MSTSNDELIVDVVELDEVITQLDQVRAAVLERLGDAVDPATADQYAFIYWIHLRTRGEL